MEKLCSTSRRLDTFFKVVNTALTVATVTCLVGLCIIAAGYLFKIPPERIGTGYDKVDFGALELTLAEGHSPDIDAQFLRASVVMALSIACFIIGKFCVKCVRNILKPMAQGTPFHAAAQVNLKKLAVLSAIMGVAVNCISLVSQYVAVREFNLDELLISEKITHVAVDYSFDLSFLIITAVLLLLSYVFGYGEKLQKLSDETL